MTAADYSQVIFDSLAYASPLLLVVLAWAVVLNVGSIAVAWLRGREE